MENICFNCGSKKVILGNDWDFDDYGIDGEGIVSTYTCADCGAEIEVIVPYKSEDEENELRRNPMTNAEKFKEVFGIDFPRDVDMCSSSSADSDMCNSDEQMCDYCELYGWTKKQYKEKPYEN